MFDNNTTFQHPYLTKPFPCTIQDNNMTVYLLPMLDCQYAVILISLNDSRTKFLVCVFHNQSKTMPNYSKIKGLDSERKLFFFLLKCKSVIMCKILPTIINENRWVARLIYP